MPQDAENLIWIDLEMTGLDTVNDHIIEIATIITNKHLEILAEGPNQAIKVDSRELETMDEWNTKQHAKSGLIKRIMKNGVTMAKAENDTIEFLRKWVPPGKSPICGNSICQDRRFLARQMPELENYFHYRNLDVSTLKELVARWEPKLLQGIKKESMHLALDDIRDSINELKYYRKEILTI